MKLVSKQQIDYFLKCKSIAIAGASRKEKSFSAEVAKHLAALNYTLWFINPNYEIDDPENFRVKSIDKLPADVKHLLILTPAIETEAIVKQAIDKGIDNIWIQQQSETPEALKLANDNGINLIHHQCIFMFTQPTGIHRFHHSIKKVFGSLPK